MATPQGGIFDEDSPHHQFLEYAVRGGADAGMAGTLAKAHAAAAATGAQVVVALGNDAWRRLAPKDAPDGLRAFESIDGTDGSRAPATQRDVLFWIHGASVGDVFDGALAVHHHLAGIASLELDERGFRYHDMRDLTGFIDGSANPKGDAARAAALVADGKPGAGGAFVLSQRWVHDLDAFGALPVAEQERVVGRTKPDSIELEGDAMPADAHVARTDVPSAKIYRRSTPFGSVSDKGLYFLAFSCDLDRFDLLLRRMFGVAEDGIRDRLTTFSRPLTGSYWFAPSEESLRALFGDA